MTKKRQIANTNEFLYWSPETTIAAIPGPKADPKNEIDEPAATTLPLRSIFASRESINGIQKDHEKPSKQLVMKKIV